MKHTNRRNARKERPTLPELDQTKRSVLNSLTSLQSRRSYQHAMDEFTEWHCSEPRLALNRAGVLRYRLHQDRVHDSLGKDTPNRRPVEQKPAKNATVDSMPRLGGLRHRYCWRAAA